MNTEITNEAPEPAITNNETTATNDAANNPIATLQASFANLRQNITDGIERQQQRFSPDGLARLKDYLIKGTIAGVMLLGAIKTIQESLSDAPRSGNKAASWSFTLSIPLIAATYYAIRQRLTAIARDDDGITVADAASLTRTSDVELGTIAGRTQLYSQQLNELATQPETLRRSSSQRSLTNSATANRQRPARSLSFP